MPVKPAPTKYTCQQCGWHDIAMPQSDVLSIDGETSKKMKVPADFFSCCQECGSSLVAQPATSSEILLATIKRKMNW
ncbi:MAG: hypothetical protein V3U71_05175 [Cocleimonas sp.]